MYIDTHLLGMNDGVDTTAMLTTEKGTKYSLIVSFLTLILGIPSLIGA